MKYRAVIFDLFGTLVENFTGQGYDNALADMASVLSLTPADFKKAWFDGPRSGDPDMLKRIEYRVESICNGFGVKCEKGQVSRAVQIRLGYIRHVMTPRPSAVETLTILKETGYKRGLISDCSDEIPVLWPDSPLSCLFDTAIFSCVAGFRKPDPRIYALAMGQLAVRPEECLYIGDGGSQELSGALKAGMQPVQLRLDAGSTERHLSTREPWTGRMITSIKEVLGLVGEG